MVKYFKKMGIKGMAQGKNSNINIKVFSVIGFGVLLTLACSKVDKAADGVGAGEHRIFVTAADYTATQLAGNPDLACQTAANDAGLTKTYVAIVSTSIQDARDKIGDDGGAIKKVDSTNQASIIADQFSGTGGLWDTTTTNLQLAVDLDENGDDNSGATIFTGTKPDGTKFGAAPVDFCNNWANSTGTNAVVLGSSSSRDQRWIDNNSSGDCSIRNHLYCISI